MSDDNQTNLLPSVYDLFDSKADLERDGKWFSLGTMQFKLARSGGNNVEFLKSFRKRMLPMKKLIDSNQLPEKQSQRLLAQVLSEAVVRDWKDVIGRDGQPIPYSKDACLQLFTELPNLMLAVNQIADNFENFQNEQLEEDAKN